MQSASLLAKVGKAYRLDRVSMVEIERDYHSFHYSYQWAKNKTTCKWEILIILSQAEWKNFLRNMTQMACAIGNFMRTALWLPA